MSEMLECGHTESPHSDFTRGYGMDSSGARYCYDCCAARESADMIARGKGTLYLVQREGRYFLTDWPGKLSFPASVSKGRHNMARVRYDARFIGPDGKQWHSVTYGDNTQIAHCKRMKGAA